MEQNWTSYLHSSTDSVINVVDNTTKDLELPLDRLSVGKGLLYQYDGTGNSTYKETLASLRNSIDLEPRNSLGGLWYYVYPNWSYLDGMFSLLSFYPLYTLNFNIADMTEVNNDIFLQIELIWEHCYDNKTGLLFHGYDATKTASWANPTTGASPIVWNRSLGWFVMGLVDLLELQLMDSRVATWRARFTDLANAIVNAVDAESGCWWQVMSSPGREGNYIESSGSAMFTYALYKGVRLGLLQDASQSSVSSRYLSHTQTNYTGIATRAYRGLVNRFVVENADGTSSYNGTVGVCSLNSTASYEYYTGQPIVFNSVLGSAAFVRASLEHELAHGSDL
ncbi:hypothetical protein N7495_009892 [Penicillium taxi]|uniref:uncharacterized protein n=1 Tax=Penicillium taxi TaxID=168475 RepID=UPI002544EA61|nr:uncharacterized protein N7495_009892 [Penicillium taxi]KAJ5885382.1 hypothetical protein N7495_009892 [Penicillium taxi]